MNEPPHSVEEIARELSYGLEARGVPYAIGGAIAFNQWGVPRGTTDVDVNVWMDPSKPTVVADLLAGLGCELNTAAVVREFLDKGWAYALLRGVHVDVYLPTRPFHESVLRRRVQRDLLGRPAWFLSVEDLAVFKLILHRLKDRADLEALLMVQGSSFDRAYVVEWIGRIAGSLDPRLKTWGELVASADAALRRRSGG